MKVLVGCESSGTVRDAFIRAGHEAMSCGLLPCEKAGPHYRGDLFDVIDFPWDLAIFHPPCTHLAVSGARHFEAKRLDGRQQAAVAFFMQIQRRAAHIPMTATENPVCIMSSLWRKPDQTIEPYWFGHPEFKSTCLWLKGLLPLRPTNLLSPPAKGAEGWAAWNRVHRMPPGEDRWKERSRTFIGVAEAMASQWGEPPQRVLGLAA